MSWVWLGLLFLASATLWLRRRLALRRDAMVEQSLHALGPETEANVPPAKQPWKRPGFGPPAVPNTLDYGDLPLPPPAGDLQDPSVAGPLPDDDEVPVVAIDMSPVEEPTPARVKPPPPPPPGAGEATEASAADASSAETSETAPAEAPAEATDVPSLVLDVDDEIDKLVIRGPQVLELPPDVAAEARELMQSHQEVAAVRLVCDSMGVGILDAQRTVRALVGR